MIWSEYQTRLDGEKANRRPHGKWEEIIIIIKKKKRLRWENQSLKVWSWGEMVVLRGMLFMWYCYTHQSAAERPEPPHERQSNQEQQHQKYNGHDGTVRLVERRNEFRFNFKPQKMCITIWLRFIIPILYSYDIYLLIHHLARLASFQWSS